jgi:hypothetical protein
MTSETKGCHCAGAIKAFRPSILILSALASYRLDRLVCLNNKRACRIFNAELDGLVCFFGVAGSKVRDRLKHAVSRPITEPDDGR